MIVIGTRGSRLALAQTAWVRDRILARFPGTEIRVDIIGTSADRDKTTSLRSVPSAGVFVKELEHALLRGEIDLAVHSLKDVPTLIADGCAIAAVPEREDPRDALIARGPVQLDLLPRGARIGTGSFRRQAQLLALRPDLEIVDMRGNIETRIGKMEAGGCDAVMLAAAGLRRLGMAARISLLFDFGQMMPAPGQGALALETREGDVRVARYAAAIHHPDTARAVAAERAFLERMGGGCNVPIAAYARPVPGGLEIDGLVASPDGRRMVRDRVSTTGATDVEGIALLARKLLARGAREILEEFRA
ncbi:MAG: hydroxymethylbilane synthase [Acidobacteriota bacterium]|jgi:hydroxymethylbilane synthase|nr:hydroxymethylbilane synthase [Acidobacteriota bacterium]